MFLNHIYQIFDKQVDGPIAFLSDERCADFGEIEIVEPTELAADLARGAELALMVAPRDYCGLAVPLNRHTSNLPASAPEQLADHSIVLKGERADGQPFLLLHSEQDTLELAAAQGDIEIGADGRDLVLSFDVAAWLAGIDLDAVEPEDDGVIHIDVDHNRALLDAYEANLECSVELFADEDRDGSAGTDAASLAHCIAD